MLVYRICLCFMHEQSGLDLFWLVFREFFRDTSVYTTRQTYGLVSLVTSFCLCDQTSNVVEGAASGGGCSKIGAFGVCSCIAIVVFGYRLTPL